MQHAPKRILILLLLSTRFRNDARFKKYEYADCYVHSREALAQLCELARRVLQSSDVPSAGVYGVAWNCTWGISTRRAGKLDKARSRLYRSQNLQENMRWKALAEIYPKHSFVPVSNLKILVRNCSRVSRGGEGAGESAPQ